LGPFGATDWHGCGDGRARHGDGHERRDGQAAAAERADGHRGAARARQRSENGLLEPIRGGDRQEHAEAPALGAHLVAELAAVFAVAQVASKVGVPKCAAERGELRADLGTRGFAGRAVGGERGPGLEHERLDLLPLTAEDPCDLLVGEVAELGEDERGALIMRQPRDVGQCRAHVLAGEHRGGQVIGGRLR
jgi:hypothetical protein